MHEQRETCLNERLLNYIRNGRNDEAKAMLTEKLAQAFDDSDMFGTLLHHAISNNNVVIARRLIELGADVNRFGGYSTTPLMTAVMSKNVAAVEVLLEANANIDIIDDNGFSPLKVALDSTYFSPKIVEILGCKLRTEAGTNEELAERLIAARCNMYHAAMLRDVDLMDCMLKRGVNVNSKGLTEKTALHVAVELEDVNLVNWLLNNGLDVNAVDQDGLSALAKSAESGNKVMVQYLLEHGAYPDVKGKSYECTPLYAAFSRLIDGPDEFVECAEILLQHGATLQDSIYLLEMFHFALDRSCDKAVKLLIAHLAMLEKLGKPVHKSVMHSMDYSYRTKMSELRKYYEPCQQVLTIMVFEKLSLLDLLNESDRKLRLLVRKETFLQEVERVSSEHKLNELYSYYCKSMMRRIEKANRVVKLEDEVILTICKIFKANHNQFYDFARGVVEYLNECDLKNLVQV